MTTARRRTLADMATDILTPADARAPGGPTSSPAAVEPGPAGDASADAAASSTASAPASAGAGPRLRASERSTLAGGDVRRTVYMPPDLWRDVLRLADGEGVTAAAIVRRAVAEHVERARRRR